MPVRIIHITESLGFGGAERQLAEIVANTDPARFKHLVCSLVDTEGFSHQVRESGHQVVSLGLKSGRQWVKAGWKLRGVMQEFQPDVMHGWLFNGIMAMRMARLMGAGVPGVGSLQNPDYEPETIRSAGWPAWKMSLFKVVDRIGCKWYPRKYISCSKFVSESTKRQLKVADDKVSVIYNSVNDGLCRNVTDANTSALRAELGISDEALVVSTVGRLDPQKGQSYLLKAFAQLLKLHPNSHLVVVGAGPLESSLRDLGHQFQIEKQVHFLGLRKDIGTILKMSQMFVFPSLFEGFGIALAEAQLAGLPVVTTHVGPLPELVEDGVTGLLVPPADVGALVVAMNKFAESIELRKSIGENASHQAQSRFGVRESIAPQWERLYQDIAFKAKLTKSLQILSSR